MRPLQSFEEKRFASSLIEQILEAQTDVYLRVSHENNIDYLRGILDGYSSVLLFLEMSVGTQQKELKETIRNKLCKKNQE